MNSTPAKKMFLDKVWDEHRILDLGDGFDLLHVDRHMMHEITSTDGIEFLNGTGRNLRNPDLNFATPDHVVSTKPGRQTDSIPRFTHMITSMRENSKTHGFTLFDLDDDRQGIVHVVAPEQGIALPGATLVCGDSHTCTVGGVGALSWGIGTSEVKHVMATQTIVQTRPKSLRVRFDGLLPENVSSKDMILYLIGKLGAASGDGYAIEYAGTAVRSLDVESRLTLCNLSIELGAKIGHVAPDDTTYEYLLGKPFSPKDDFFDRAVTHWRTLPSDDEASADMEVTIDASSIGPQITWGTSPEHVIGIEEVIPNPEAATSDVQRRAWESALNYMGLEAGVPISKTSIDVVFIGSCTNSRLSDIHAAAEVVRGRKVAKGVRALAVPGSGWVKRAAESDGSAAILQNAGFEWREPGCSMCVAMNDDVVEPGKRAVSTSNRNFEGRQGDGARTHLASPATAAASAIAGFICDPTRLAD
jgi:3-isopropylmalate/(R)-2-methylmalate dehydratase large subunit